MSTARTKQRPTSRVTMAVATSGFETWALPTAAGVIALAGALATSFELVDAPIGLAVAVLGLLALIAERGLTKAVPLGVPAVVGLALAWTAICYTPFHAYFFPGTPLHEPVTLHSSDASLPVTLTTGGRTTIDLMLEGQLPANPNGGPALPVQYTITLEDTAAARQVLSGTFKETLSTRRLGRRGTATVITPHHEEHRVVANPAGGDLKVTGVTLEPAAGASVAVAAFAHRLPSTPILVVLALAFLGAVVAVDTRVVPSSEGTLTVATPAALGAALVLWTSDTVHLTVSSLIGAIIFGGALGLMLGTLLWAIARRTLVHDRR